MNAFIDFFRPAAQFLMRRTVFLLLGTGVGYAYGYHQADAGVPSVFSRAQSLVGVDHVRDDHMRRQRAVEALRQARMDSIDAQVPH
jgi:hypothetical protein